jgi:hypothetical protein
MSAISQMVPAVDVNEAASVHPPHPCPHCAPLLSELADRDAQIAGLRGDVDRAVRALERMREAWDATVLGEAPRKETDHASE